MRPDLGSERSDLESKRPDLGSDRLYLRLGGGRTDGRKPEKIVLCGIIGHLPLRGRCPKKGGMVKEHQQGGGRTRINRTSTDRVQCHSTCVTR